MSRDLAGVSLSITTALFWGFLPFILIPVLRDVGVVEVVWFRFLFSFLFLFCTLGWRYRARLSDVFRAHPAAYAAGVALALNYYCFSKGLHLTTASTAQILIQSGPLVFTLLSLFAFRERLSRSQWVGIVVATLGFALFYKNKLENLLGDIHIYQVGVLWVLMGGLTWAIYAYFSKIAGQRIAGQRNNLVIYGLSTLLYWPFVEFSNFTELSTSSLGLLVLSGVNTLIAYGALSEALERTSSAKVSIIVALNPLITLTVSTLGYYLVWSWIPPERLEPMAWFGGMMVMTGAVLVVAARSTTKKSE